MKRLQVMKRVLRETGASRFWFAFLIQFFASGLIIWLREPDFHSYGDALWYLYAVVTTIGFGDMTAVSTIGRILSVILGVYGIVVVALITSIIVNFYGEMKKSGGAEMHWRNESQPIDFNCAKNARIHSRSHGFEPHCGSS